MKVATVLALTWFGGVVVAQATDLPLATPATWAGVVVAILWLIRLERQHRHDRAMAAMQQEHERHLANHRHEETMARLARLDEREGEDRRQIAINGRAAGAARDLAAGLYLERAAAVPDLAEEMRRVDSSESRL